MSFDQSSPSITDRIAANTPPPSSPTPSPTFTWTGDDEPDDVLSILDHPLSPALLNYFAQTNREQDVNSGTLMPTAPQQPTDSGSTAEGGSSTALEASSSLEPSTIESLTDLIRRQKAEREDLHQRYQNARTELRWGRRWMDKDARSSKEQELADIQKLLLTNMHELEVAEDILAGRRLTPEPNAARKDQIIREIEFNLRKLDRENNPRRSSG